MQFGADFGIRFGERLDAVVDDIAGFPVQGLDGRQTCGLVAGGQDIQCQRHFDAAPHLSAAVDRELFAQQRGAVVVEIAAHLIDAGSTHVGVLVGQVESCNRLFQRLAQGDVGADPLEIVLGRGTGVLEAQRVGEGKLGIGLFFDDVEVGDVAVGVFTRIQAVVQQREEHLAGVFVARGDENVDQSGLFAVIGFRNREQRLHEGVIGRRIRVRGCAAQQHQQTQGESTDLESYACHALSSARTFLEQ